MAYFVHPRYLPDRRAMLQLLPKACRMAEIGVFDGGFSAEILEIVSPTQLVLIDLWADELVQSGDVDGRNVREIRGSDLEQTVRSRFANDARASVLKGTSRLLGRFPDEHFDAIYLDADHSYEAVRLDLLASFRALKPGGWLMGHDYGINPERTDSRWAFGVRRAVDEFCESRGESVSFFAMDGCTSFAIQLTKKATRKDVFVRELFGFRASARRLVRAVTARA
jgi:predicted O-methyltransferase YrrM